MAQAADLPGAAHLELVDGVIHLDPKPALFDAMLTGWVRQQQTRFLSEQGTIKPRVALVRRLAEFTNAYPWEWTPSDVEAFFSQLRSSSGRKPIEMSTGRGYKQTLSVFMEYITDRRYGWPEACLERFGQFPRQILHEDNTVVHTSEYEGRPGRRPLTYDEVQSLFDALDTKVDTARASGRKGGLTALRDAALLKMIYAFGLRRNEARMLDLADLRRAQKSPQYRQYGGLFVRYGKASKGSPPKRAPCSPSRRWTGSSTCLTSG